MDDKNAPASKGDIADLRSELKVEMGQLRAEARESAEQIRAEARQNVEQLRAEMSHGYNDIVERIHDAQTELLKAFYGYAQGNNKRVASLRATRARSAAVLRRSKTASSKSNAVSTSRRPHKDFPF